MNLRGELASGQELAQDVQELVLLFKRRDGNDENCVNSNWLIENVDAHVGKCVFEELSPSHKYRDTRRHPGVSRCRHRNCSIIKHYIMQFDQIGLGQRRKSDQIV